MDITVGAGKNRKTFVIPSAFAAKISKDKKIQLERAAEDVKNFLFRPKMLSR